MTAQPSPHSAAELRRAWERHSAAELDSYLVQEAENPCFNPQSVLVRALLADSLGAPPGSFDALIAEEMLYAACAATAILAAREGWFDSFRDAVARGVPHPALPGFVRAAGAENPASFSIPSLLDDIARGLGRGFDDFASPFEARWREALDAALPADPVRQRPSVLELACGSANDARYVERYGLAERIDYVGIDIAAANLANARRHFPRAAFLQADVAALPFADDAVDFLIAFDIFEHLSPDGLEHALAEAARVTRSEMWLSFFNLGDLPAHRTEKNGDRFWNLLSAQEITARLAALGCESYIIDLPAEWESQLPGYRHYNPEARIVVAR